MNSYDYLYSDGENYFFMNQNTYEQVELPKSTLDGAEMFLNDGDKVMLQEYDGNPINVNLDPTCVLEVIETPPVLFSVMGIEMLDSVLITCDLQYETIFRVFKLPTFKYLGGFIGRGNGPNQEISKQNYTLIRGKNSDFERR